jgi:hypothetical protein
MIPVQAMVGTLSFYDRAGERDTPSTWVLRPRANTL